MVDPPDLPLWSPFRSYVADVADSTDPAHLVVRVTREWPWGLAMWSDIESSEPPPESFDERGVAAAETVIVGPILHEIDGPATAELWLGEPPTSSLCVYDATFELMSGRLALSDAAMERVDEVALSPGTYRARLCLDDAEFPEVSSLYLSPSR